MQQTTYVFHGPRGQGPILSVAAPSHCGRGLLRGIGRWKRGTVQSIEGGCREGVSKSRHHFNASESVKKVVLFLDSDGSLGLGCLTRRQSRQQRAKLLAPGGPGACNPNISVSEHQSRRRACLLV